MRYSNYNTGVQEAWEGAKAWKYYYWQHTVNDGIRAMLLHSRKSGYYSAATLGIFDDHIIRLMTEWLIDIENRRRTMGYLLHAGKTLEESLACSVAGL